DAATRTWRRSAIVLIWASDDAVPPPLNGQPQSHRSPPGVSGGRGPDAHDGEGGARAAVVRPEQPDAQVGDGRTRFRVHRRLEGARRAPARSGRDGTEVVRRPGARR